jgi:hypothetical protein
MQLAVTYLIVGAAAALVLRSAWRTWTGKKAGCGTGCEKCGAPAPPEQKGRFPLPQA